MKKILKDNIKLLIGIVIGFILTGSIVYGATPGYLYDSNEVSYNNQTSGLTSTDIQSVLDELDTKVDTLNNNYTTCTNNYNTCNSSLSTCQNSLSSLYTASVTVNNGTISGGTTKYGSAGAMLTFNVSPSSGYCSTATPSCTNSQTATIANNKLTTSALTANTTCSVTFPTKTYSLSTRTGLTGVVYHANSGRHAFCCTTTQPTMNSSTGKFTLNGTLYWENSTSVRNKYCYDYSWADAVGTSCGYNGLGGYYYIGSSATSVTSVSEGWWDMMHEEIVQNGFSFGSSWTAYKYTSVSYYTADEVCS